MAGFRVHGQCNFSAHVGSLHHLHRSMLSSVFRGLAQWHTHSDKICTCWALWRVKSVLYTILASIEFPDVAQTVINDVLATEHWSLKPHGHLLQNKSSQGIRHIEPRVGHRFSCWPCSLWTPRAALPPVEAKNLPSSSGKISVFAPMHCSCLLLHRWRCGIILVQGNQPQVPKSECRISSFLLKFVKSQV